MGVTITDEGQGYGKSKSLFISQLGAATRSINAEIKKTIIKVKAVDTGRMKNNTKVKLEYNFSKDEFYFTEGGIRSTFYYIYVDEGTIHIKPRLITQKTLAKPKVQKALDKVFDKWTDYMIDKQFETIKL
jgi:hypothetical protein